MGRTAQELDGVGCHDEDTTVGEVLVMYRVTQG